MFLAIEPGFLFNELSADNLHMAHCASIDVEMNSNEIISAPRNM